MGNKFKAARVLLGKSQLQLAAETRMHVTLISQLENGWRNPTQDQIERLKKALPNLDQIERLSR